MESLVTYRFYLLENQVDLTPLKGIMIGIVLFVVGIIALVVGIILVIMERGKENRKQPPLAL
jgi:hypothetical protein